MGIFTIYHFSSPCMYCTCLFVCVCVYVFFLGGVVLCLFECARFLLQLNVFRLKQKASRTRYCYLFNDLLVAAKQDGDFKRPKLVVHLHDKRFERGENT